MWTSLLFLGAILATVIYLSVTHRDQIPAETPAEAELPVG
jgi:hypothetical protein